MHSKQNFYYTRFVIDKKYLYYKKMFNYWNYSENNLTKIDNIQFANKNDLNNKKIISSILLDIVFYLIKKNIFL